MQAFINITVSVLFKCISSLVVKQLHCICGCKDCREEDGEKRERKRGRGGQEEEEEELEYIGAL